MTSHDGASDHVAVVTGGGRGLGRAIAHEFARAGYRIAVLGRSEPALTAVADELADATVMWRVCDVTRWDQVATAFADIEKMYGRIDVLVNNAGGWLPTSLEDTDPEELHRLLDTTALGTMYCARAAVPGMRERGDGFILNIGSTSGLASTTDNAASSAPKGAIGTLTSTLSRELETYGIRVGVLHPASIDKNSAPEHVPPAQDGRHLGLGQQQVARIALFMVRQPANVHIREVVVTPTNVLA
jgi:3-oxoacyl-[acyl-carrier protein] reductase